MLKNMIAIAALVVLGVVVLLVFRDKPSDDSKTAADSIDAVDETALNTIKIKRMEGEGAEAVLEELTLKKDGDTWKMTLPINYKIVESSVRRMVDTLVALKSIDVISEDPASHAKFQVDDAKGVEVTALAGEKELCRFVMGKSSGGMTFARIPGKNAVIRVQGYHQNTFNKSISSLRNKLIVKRELTEVGKIKFESGEGTLAFEYKGEGAERKLTPVGIEIENFDESKAAGLVRSVSSFSTTGFVDEPLPASKTGLDATALKITVEPKEGSEVEAVTLFVGAELEEEKQTYVKTSESEQIFLVAKNKLNRFKITADDFARTDEELKQEEERRKAAASNPPPAMGGMPGNQQIPPDVMRQIQAQMAQKKPAN